MNDLISTSQKIDRLESVMTRFPLADMPLVHTFTPGLYTRQITMPKGSLVVSLTHKTEHPFVISKGRVSVWTDGDGVITFEAPYIGITKPGTRRVLYIHEDCIWTTFHATNLTDPEQIVAAVTEPHEIKPFADCDDSFVKRLLAGGDL